MILRRLTANFRRQDWSAVAIELVVVILGVFIGLQASNWNENRQTAAKSADFTQRLRADLRVEAWNYEYEIEYMNDVLANAKRAADALSGKAPLSDEALLIAGYRATQYLFNNRRRTTFDQLTSTGEIGLIRDPALRNLAMGDYITVAPVFTTIHDEGRNNPYRKVFRMAMPYEVQLTLAATCGDRHVEIGDYKGMAHSLDYPCSSGLPPQVIATSTAVLRNDPQFLPLLRLRIAEVSTNQYNLTLHYPEVRSGLQALAREKP